MPCKILNLDELVKRALFEASEEIVTFEPAKPFDGMEFAGITIPEVKAKELKREIDLSRFIAEFLQERKYGSIASEHEITINSVYNKLQEEQRSAALEKTSESFFIEIINTLEQLKSKLAGEEELADGIKETRQKKIERLESDFTRLVQRRREKILRKIGTLSDREIKRKLTRTEKILYRVLVDILDNYSDIIINRKPVGL